VAQEFGGVAADRFRIAFRQIHRGRTTIQTEPAPIDRVLRRGTVILVHCFGQEKSRIRGPGTLVEAGMNLPDFLTMNPDGELCLTGHRIRLIDVAARYDEGRSPEGIVLDCYPTLNLALVHKAIAFYLEHQLEVRQMLAQNSDEMRRLLAEVGATPHPTLDELRARLETRRRAEAS
jgi:uncharacterized protein (DUF433 family)